MVVTIIGTLGSGAVLIQKDGTLYEVNTLDGAYRTARFPKIEAYLRPGMFIPSNNTTNRIALETIADPKRFIPDPVPPAAQAIASASKFDMAPAEVVVDFVPQCGGCVFNVSDTIEDCAKFSPKPMKYRDNSVPCPLRKEMKP